jgi:hypothetical protein
MPMRYQAFRLVRWNTVVAQNDVREDVTLLPIGELREDKQSAIEDARDDYDLVETRVHTVLELIVTESVDW